MPVVDGRDVPFREAIGFLRDKIELPTETWTDLWQGMHARAFVVAGARDADLVADFHEAVRRGLEDGTTLEAFREDFDRIVARHGWSYRGGRGWRSRVIFETNLRTAYQAGRWRQIQEVKEDRPWLRYVAVRDARTRPDHAAWHGAVLHADDPWWRTHYPPNGWGCRCIVQQLSGDDLEAFGYAASAGAPRVEWESRTVNTPDGEVALRVPRGIDTGWAYNVGEAGFGRGAGLIAQERHGKWQGLFAPGGSRPADPGRVHHNFRTPNAQGTSFHHSSVVHGHGRTGGSFDGKNGRHALHAGNGGQRPERAGQGSRRCCEAGEGTPSRGVRASRGMGACWGFAERGDGRLDSRIAGRYGAAR